MADRLFVAAEVNEHTFVWIFTKETADKAIESVFHWSVYSPFPIFPEEVERLVNAIHAASNIGR